MAQTGFTPIQLYSSSTTGNTPAAADLLNSSGGSELAINIFDGKLFYKDNSGNVQVIGWKVVPVSAGGTGQTSYTDGQLLIGNTTGNTLTKATLTAGTGITITNGSGTITINGNGGTVTSVAALTLGTTGTDLSSTVANGTTTPVITLNVPTASATNRGALSAADWTTFNNKQPAGTYVTNLTGPITSVGNATSIASQTGTGTKFVVDTSPTLVTPTATTTIGVGAATPSASGAGITFPATQSASSDANTLDDYEEGTWTPSQGAGLTVIGSFSSIGTYTKIGRFVTVRGVVSGSTSIACATGSEICGGLPFSSVADSAGSFFNGNLSQGGAIDASGTAIYAVGTIGASAAIFITVSYQI